MVWSKLSSNIKHRKKRKNSGFTLVELLVALSILVVVITPLTIALIKNGQFLVRNKEKLVAESIASEQIEIIRNLSYDDVGTNIGQPHGIITACPAPMTKDGITFQVYVDIRYVDDPYDQITPIDTHPDDYKKAEVIVIPLSNPNEDIECPYDNTKPKNNITTLTTDIARTGPETDAETGVLQISVNDASGSPVAGALVNVINMNNVYPPIITTTQIDGKVTIPALPPDDTYHIVITKTGYSTDQTYPMSEENPNPTPKDQSVLVLQLTSISFSIDLLSAMTINTVDVNGAPILDPVTFTIHSEKKIGSDGLGNPIYKYTSTQTTSSGLINFTDMEWDSYTFTLDGASAIKFAILDTSVDPPQPDISTSVSLPPNSDSSFNIVLTAGPAPTPSPNP
jgi:prepilin-type N-terminal cleavage/methylation domain-containing protein